MAQFLKTDQSKYVPLHGNDTDEQIVLESIFLDGDQLRKSVLEMYNGFSKMGIMFMIAWKDLTQHMLTGMPK